jgi:hypothetical protein
MITRVTMNLISILREKSEHCKDCFYCNSAKNGPKTISDIKKVCIKLNWRMSNAEVSDFIEKNCLNNIWVKDPTIYDSEQDYDLD